LLPKRVGKEHGNLFFVFKVLIAELYGQHLFFVPGDKNVEANDDQPDAGGCNGKGEQDQSEV